MHLGHGGVNVPQRQYCERDEPARIGRAPFVDHEVVVRARARKREHRICAAEEPVPREAREVGEVDLRPHAIEVHVGEACDRVVTARAHLGEAGDALGLVIETGQCPGAPAEGLHDLVVVVDEVVALDVVEDLQDAGSARDGAVAEFGVERDPDQVLVAHRGPDLAFD